MAMPLLGQVLRRNARREAVMFLRDGALWVADFIDGEGELVDAATWVRFNCAGVAPDPAQRRMVKESAIPLSAELATRIESLLGPGPAGAQTRGSRDAVAVPWRRAPCAIVPRRPVSFLPTLPGSDAMNTPHRHDNAARLAAEGRNPNARPPAVAAGRWPNPARGLSAALCACAAVTAHAGYVLTPGLVNNALTGAYNANLTFNVSGVSEWGNTASVATGNRFVGLGPYDIGKTIGGITEDPLFGTRWGAQLGARVQAVAGLNFGLQANGGSLAMTYPVSVGLQFPDPLGALNVGSTFSIGSSYRVSPITTSFTYKGVPINLTIDPTMAVTGPSLQTFAESALGFHAFAGAQVCTGTCFGPALGPIDIADFSKELVAINRNGDNQVRIAGVQANLNQQYNGDYLSAVANLPTLDAQGALASDRMTLSSNVDGNLLGLNASLDKIIWQVVQDQLGLDLPDLNGSIGPLNYNLVKSDAGMSLNITQQIQFTPAAPAITLNFTSPVQQLVGASFGAPTTQVSFHAGDTIELRAPGAQTLGVLPTFSLGGTASNATDLQLAGQVGFSALALSLDGTGLSLGPLVSQTTPLALGSSNIVDSRFGVDFGQQLLGNPYNLRFDPSNIVDPVARSHLSDTGYLSLLSTSACDSLTRCLSDPQQALIGVFQDPVTILQSYLDCLGDPAATPLNCAALLPADFERLGLTPTRVLDGSGNDLFLGDLASLLNPVEPNVQPNGSDAEMERQLARLGFDFNFQPLSVPPALPEPGTLPLLSLAVLALAAQRRRGARDGPKLRQVTGLRSRNDVVALNALRAR